MNHLHEPTESLSPKAAAFSITRLLTGNPKNEDYCPSSFRTSLFPATNACTGGIQPRLTQQATDFEKIEPSPKTSSAHHLPKCRNHSIDNILGKIDEHEHKCHDRVLSASQSMDPLQQFAACCDLVRNLDMLKSNAVRKADTRFLNVQSEIQVALQHSELWWKFYACGTEMVITRTGRRMFPTLALSILGMDPRKNYAIHVDIVPVDGYSYTFVNNMWQVNGMASEMHHLPYVQSYQADEVARSGLYWMKNGVDFKKVRLTNRRTGSFKEGELHLSPNRKYQPRVHVVEETDEGVELACSTYVFPETTFIAVTTYQNEELIQMKIDHNPFAKGFRDKGSRRRFVPYEPVNSDDSLCNAIQDVNIKSHPRLAALS